MSRFGPPDSWYEPPVEPDWDEELCDCGDYKEEQHTYCMQCEREAYLEAKAEAYAEEHGRSYR